MAIVVFSAAQRKRVDGVTEVEIEAARVVDLIEKLEERFPRLQGLLGDLAVAIDGDIHQDARFVALERDSEVHFIGAIAGGAGRAADARGRATDPLECALAWKRAGRGVALATVLETWGSSPCPAGSLLVVAETGEFEGSVSGGCVEGAVIEAAMELLAESGLPERDRSRRLDFDVADESAWDVGLACGGRVRVRVEPIE